MGRYLELTRRALESSQGAALTYEKNETNEKRVNDPCRQVARPWPAASLEAERRFGRPHAKLFPFLGRKVRTPVGVGTLIQVIADRCTVVLDSQMSQCAWLLPSDIVPVSWEF